MFCRKCGKELGEDVKFCRYCGEQITIQSEKENKRNKTHFQKKWWLVIILIIIFGGILVLIRNRNSKINLEEYVRAEFYGYDTVGDGYYYIDKTEIPEELWSTIYLTPDYSENLSNGDEIVISIHYDNAKAKEYDVKLSGEQVTVEVSGLTELVEINPFDGFSFELYGISPFGMAEFSYNGNNDYIKKDDFYYYDIEDEMHLRNGNTVTIEYMNPENPAEYGYKITEYFKDYIVEGLDEYVESFEDLPESFLEYAKTETVDSINAYTAKQYNQFVGMTPLEYTGYIYKVKKSAVSGEYNVLYLIYKSCLSHELDRFEEQYIYYPVKYTDLVLVNGQISAQNQGIQGDTQESYDTDGYRMPTLAYSELAEESQDIYNVTVGDGFEIFAANNYIYSVSDISNEIMQILESRAVAVVNEYLTEGDEFKWYTESQPVKVGGYLLVSKKQGNLKEASNQLIIVYSSIISDESGGSSVLYLPVIYENLQVFQNGDFTYSDKDITGNYCGINYSWSNHTKGYIDEQEMYSDLVKKFMDNYNEEVFGDLQAY